MGDELEIRLNLKIELRHKVNRRQLQRLVSEAVQYWGKQYAPDDELFDGVKKVTVSFPKVSP